MLLVGCGSNGSEQPPTLSDDSLYATFRDPGNEWRGKPSWSWNGRLEKDELIRQLHVFKEMGMGGAFLHSRVGLKTEYLGPEWFDLTNAVVDEAARLGMEAYLYDERPLAVGQRRGHGDRRYVVADEVSYSGDDARRAVRVERRGDRFGFRLRSERDRLLEFAAPESRVKHGRLCRQDGAQVRAADMPESDVYNGTTYLDVFNPKATERFIELTHEQYRKHCGERIGTTIEGIFTDEPHRGGIFSTFGPCRPMPVLGR